MAAYGPALPSAASAGQGSYLVTGCRQVRDHRRKRVAIADALVAVVAHADVSGASLPLDPWRD